jgi:hypothetical protein
MESLLPKGSVRVPIPANTVNILRLTFETQNKITHIGIIEHWSQNPVEKYKPNENMYFCPPGYHQRAPNPSDLYPVKGYNAHAQPSINTEELVDGNIGRPYPAYEGENAESLEQEACYMSHELVETQKGKQKKKYPAGRRKRTILPSLS